MRLLCSVSLYWSILTLAEKFTFKEAQFHELYIIIFITISLFEFQTLNIEAGVKGELCFYQICFSERILIRIFQGSNLLWRVKSKMLPDTWGGGWYYFSHISTLLCRKLFQKKGRKAKISLQGRKGVSSVRLCRNEAK